MWEMLRGLSRPVLLGLFYLTLLPFTVHAVRMAGVGLSDDAAQQSYLFVTDEPFGNVAMLAHILCGSVLVALVPLQLVRGIRLNYTRFHRVLGRVLIALALITGLAGMAYIPLRGTIGGPVMSAGFFLYGVLLFGSALMVARMAILNDRVGHWAWGLRLFWLALGSWLYRVHYTLWYLLTGGLWSNPAFSGGFDLVQNFAFYLPYLAAVQIWIARRNRTHRGELSLPGTTAAR